MSTGCAPPERGPGTAVGVERDRIPPHVSLHAVLVRDGEAHFDDRILHDQSGVQAGVKWTASRDELEEPERWGVVWVGVTHEADGTRAYAGLVADEFWIDVRNHKGYRDAERQERNKAAALQGRLELGGLSATEREAVRQALILQDPDAWDRAPLEVQRALRA